MTELPIALLEGYHEFTTGEFAHESERYRRLAEQGQTPETVVIACCDSRAAPETIFNSHAGGMFVIRNVANLVPPHNADQQHGSTSAALEYAIQVLEVKHVVVMGHGGCGGIKAALNSDVEPLSPGDFIGNWLDMLAPTAAAVSADQTITKAEKQTKLEHISIRNSIENLRTFPRISMLESEGKLRLHGAWFDISIGELWAMDTVSGDFSRINFGGNKTS